MEAKRQHVLTHNGIPLVRAGSKDPLKSCIVVSARWESRGRKPVLKCDDDVTVFIALYAARVIELIVNNCQQRRQQQQQQQQQVYLNLRRATDQLKKMSAIILGQGGHFT